MKRSSPVDARIAAPSFRTKYTVAELRGLKCERDKLIPSIYVQCLVMFTCKNMYKPCTLSLYTELWMVYQCCIYHDNSCRFVVFACKKCAKLVGVIWWCCDIRFINV